MNGLVWSPTRAAEVSIWKKGKRDPNRSKEDQSESNAAREKRNARITKKGVDNGKLVATLE